MRAGRGASVSLWALFALAGCGSKHFPDSDADAGALDAGAFELAAPEPPAPPVMTPCPKGWREVADADDPSLVTCDPWPEGGPVDCTGAEAHFPGGAGCERIGPACPAGDYADDLPAGGPIVYVLAGAAAGGDGSLGAPFASIGAAIAAAPEGAIVAISKGTFDEVLSVRDPLTLWGACVEQTILAPSVPSTRQAALAISAGATVKNLQISCPRAGITVGPNADDATLEAVLVRSQGYGLPVHTRGHLVARDLVVRDIAPWDDGTYGRGLEVSGASHVELSRAVFERCGEIGILVLEASSEIVATELAIRDTESNDDAVITGPGLWVTSGGRAEITRGAFEENQLYAILALDADTEVVATDVVVRGTRSRESDGFGRGVQAAGGAHATLSRVTIDGNHDDGGFAIDPGTLFAATDLVIRDTESVQPGDRYGRGLGVQDGARVEITRAVLARNRETGMFVARGGASMVATDLVIRDTRPQEVDDQWGSGLVLQAGAHAEIHRATLERNRLIGVIADGSATELVATDLAVRDTEPQGDGLFGRGLAVQAGAHVEIVRASVERNHDYGVFALSADTTLTLEDLLVTETRARGCSPDCPGVGTGLVAQGSAAIVATRLRIADNLLCGVQLLEGGTVDLHEGEVSGNAIGVNVQTEGFDVARLQDRIRYVDNDVVLDSQNLPVPEAISLPAP